MLEFAVALVLGGVVAAFVGWVALKVQRRVASRYLMASWGAGILTALIFIGDIQDEPLLRAILSAAVSFGVLWMSAWLVLAVWPWIRANLGGAAPFADGKPEVSVDQYAPLLQTALQAVVEGTNEVTKLASQIETDENTDLAEYLRRQSLLFEQVNARRIELEAVRPEHRLQELHTQVVKFLRAYLKVLNASAGSLAASAHGNFAESRRLSKEAESWKPILDSVSVKMRRSFQRLRSEQPTLHGMLGLPLPLLVELGIEPSPAT